MSHKHDLLVFHLNKKRYKFAHTKYKTEYNKNQVTKNILTAKKKETALA